MRRGAIALLVFFCGLVCNSCPASAHVPAQFCRDYFLDKPDYVNGLPDKAISQYLTLRSGAGVAVCTQIDGRTQYYAIQAATRSAPGICRFAVVPLYRGTLPNGGAVWRSEPEPGQETAMYGTRVYKTAADKCPAQYVSGYFQVAELADEDVLALARFWKEIGTSKDAFDRAFAAIPRRDDARELWQALARHAPWTAAYMTSNEKGFSLEVVIDCALYRTTLERSPEGFTVVDFGSGSAACTPDF